MAASRIQGITVEIGGDTTKLQTALKGVNSEIRSTQSQLRDVEKLLKLDPGNTELLVQKQRLLGEAVSETKEKLAALKTAAEQANTALANGEISQSKYDALQREIIETENKLKSLEKQADNSSVALAKLGAMGEKLKMAGGNISAVGEKLMPVSAAVAGLGTVSVTTAAGFESSMSQVQATMGITADSMSSVNGQSVKTMDTLSELAKQMGKETAFSASECADALNYLALAGYDTQEMYDTLPIVLNLAAAGNIDLASASDMVTDAMSALGMESSDAGTMVDQMAKTASSANTSVSQLGEGILTIGGTAKSVKGGTAELNTALGILANSGIKGSEGGTHLRNVLLSLQNPTDKAAAQMEQLGLQVYDSEGNMRSLNSVLGDLNTSMDGLTEADKNNIIATIFNKTDLAAINALLASTGESWDSLQQSIINSGGAAAQMAETQLDNLQGQLTLLKSALESLAISFGELLLPAIKGIVEHIQGFVDKLNSMDEGTKKTIVNIGLFVAAAAPVITVIGKIVTAVGTVISVVSKAGTVIGVLKTAVTALFTALSAANPVTLIAAAVAAVIALFVVLWNKCDAFREFWINLWENIKSAAADVWNGLTEFFGTVWQGIVSLANTVWSGLSDFFSGIWESIRSAAAAAWDGITGFLSSAWEGIISLSQTIWSGLAGFFSGIWESVKNVFTSALDAVKTVVS
ncbi:MAG: phage tail tape measure protein, partial [Muribaculaceae bacterium]|nr:phage tail tape measure protein [Muribaculaceae bacterium]